VTWSGSWEADGPFAGALVEGDAARVRAVNQRIAKLGGPLVLVQAANGADTEPYCLNWLLEEVSMSVNTAAAGGNASLMTIG
jgi:RHH-type proline utilization regulon transcriptional repressor/proline dehydrogenase/delta 1-pyrroline-5-carboxylate dehydrogenase